MFLLNSLVSQASPLLDDNIFPYNPYHFQVNYKRAVTLLSAN
jgi:hypothetical protein